MGSVNNHKLVLAWYADSYAVETFDRAEFPGMALAFIGGGRSSAGWSDSPMGVDYVDRIPPGKSNRVALVAPTRGGARVAVAKV